MNAARALRTGLFGLLGVASLLGAHESFAQASSVGQWTRSQALPFAPVHNVYLPNQKVMLWAPGGGHTLWDPVTGQVSNLPGAGFDLFCSGHALLPDGRVLVAGGHIENDIGLPRAAIYNPATNSWSPAPNMNAGRWYPTVTTLPNGDALVVSGSVDLTVGVNTLPQVYQLSTNSWRSLTGAHLSQSYYPRMVVAPNGRVFDLGPDQITRSLDTSGTGSWSQLGSRNGVFRDYGTAAMYADGKVLAVGGGDPPTTTAEVIDLNAATPAWRAVRPMSVARRQVNSTVLPDGTVLVTGGTSAAGFNNASGAVFSAELWNPDTEAWTTMASATVPRLYHSGAMLLPDGRVAVTGGDDQPVPEIFSPPYLFKGARPTMSGVPAQIAYGQRFSVQSAEAAGIRKVTLIRLSSVTHAFNMDQRLNVLQFTAGTGTLEITPPANGNLAPPGHYMLFLVDANGVPSVGSIVQVGNTASPTPPAGGGPAVTSLAPATAPPGGPAFTLTVNGSNFVSGAAVRWNGAARPTTFVSATQLTAAIPATDIVTAGTAAVSVLNPGGAASGTSTFTITANTTTPTTCVFPNWVQGRQYAAGTIVTYQGALYIAKFANPGYNPTISTFYWAPYQCTATPTPTTGAPAVASLAPNTATAGGAAFTLTVNGSNFVSGAAVRWNGAARTTTFVSATQLTAAITAADIATAGTAQVSVLNPGGAVSANAAFTTTAPAAATPPAVASLAPNTATAGAAAFTLTVNGSNFVSGAAVRWNGAARTTTFVSATQLRAAITAADVATAGTAQVSVANPGGAVSANAAFTVTAAATATCTFPAWVQGRQYAAGAIVTYQGALYIAKFANPGYNPTISTFYWAPYQCTGTQTPPAGAPAVASLAPNTATAGGAAFTLTVNGSNFVSGATVRWNGAARTTTFVSATQLRAAITAADIAGAGTAQVSVLNPGGAVSANAAFTVTAATGCTFPAWVQGRQYAAGAIVTYQGNLYIAKFANPGYTPTISTFYWAPYTC
ncbi:DUF1929 domain-containing protein [Ramlibacter henchirensis]|uniref:DUF1929 domain-containing protein n=1 Tax=Ramlibacter henchirensis TaxID=204072 RepID=A0A4Z0BTM8_9BURK|nr:IPT/TIG domain-containing protein [Ramlibacter henchirensis]TFZ02667.1 DUF1929 domain-containing protein [Ramlibacter henchirensis]